MKRLVHLALSFERDTEYRTNMIYHKYVYEKSKNKQFIYVISQFSLIKCYQKIWRVILAFFLLTKNKI